MGGVDLDRAHRHQLGGVTDPDAVAGYPRRPPCWTFPRRTLPNHAAGGFFPKGIPVNIIATYDFRFGLGNNCEIIRKGDDFDPPATFSMSRDEHARSLINSGAAMTPDLWAKRKAKA